MVGFPARVRALSWCVSAASLVALRAGGAWAQTDEERATARAAAREGIAAVEEGRYAEGVHLLQRAEALVHAPTHLLYLARAWEKQGRLVRARETYLKLVREELGQGASRPFRQAQAAGRKELAELDPRIPTITITVSSANATFVIVSEDEVPIPPASLGIPRPVDPGEHSYSASAEGFATATKSVTIAEGARETLTLTLLPTSASRPRDRAAASASASAALGREQGSSGFSWRTTGYVALGVGAVGVGAGTYLLVRGLDERSDANQRFRVCNPRYCQEQERRAIVDLDETSTAKLRLSIVGFAAGGAALAAGLTLLLLPVDSENPDVAVGPWLAPGSAGLAGTF